MRYKKHGGITVFLSLLISILLLFIVTLYGTGKKYVLCARVNMAADMAITSCFAEYNRELYLRYHIKCIDPSYRQYILDPDNLKNHFGLYLQSNLRESEAGAVINCLVDDTEIEDTYHLSQNYHDIEQINNYIKNKYPYLEIETEEGKINAYAWDVFGYSGNSSGNLIREGEIEYLIYGMSDDTANCDCAHDEYEEFLNNEYILIGEYADYPYIDFLKMKLLEVPYNILINRIRNVISEYMKENGSPAFDWDECVVGIIINIRVEDGNRYVYELKREYSYNAL